MQQARKTFVFLTSGPGGFSVAAEFDRVPMPGEHVFLFLSDEQRGKLDPQYRSEPATLCVVRDTVLRQQEAGVDDYVADIFVSPVAAEDWTEKMAKYGRGDG